jgi:hypothetical protein
VVEEHHRAWPAWEEARARGEIPPGATLLHLDAHEDLGIPDLTAPLPADPAGARRLADTELTPEDPVVPALLNGTLSDYRWVPPEWLGEEPGEEERWVASRGGRRRELALFRGRPAPEDFPDARRWTWRVARLDDLTAAPGVVLDVDLDWFACRNPHAGHTDVGITREEYERALAAGTVRFEGEAEEDGAVTHSIVLARPPGPWEWPVRLDRVTAADGGVTWVRGFMCMGLYRDAFPVHRPEPGELDRAFARLEEALRRLPPPALVTVARSVRSGFVPADLAPELERRLLALLAEAW